MYVDKNIRYFRYFFFRTCVRHFAYISPEANHKMKREFLMIEKLHSGFSRSPAPICFHYNKLTFLPVNFDSQLKRGTSYREDSADTERPKAVFVASITALVDSCKANKLLF